METTFFVFADLPGDHGDHGVELIVNKVEFSIAPDSWFECETSRIEGDVDGKLFTLVVRAEMDPIGVECDDPHEMILKHSKGDVPAHLKEGASEADFIFGIHPPGKGDPRVK